MKLSQDKNYIQHSRHLISGEYSSAIGCLERVLEVAEREGTSDQRSFILQTIGRTYAYMGDRVEALRFFALAEAEDPHSALSRFQFAKFLAEDLKERELAIKKCDEIIALSETNAFDPDSVVVFQTNYVDEARSLKKKLIEE